MSGEITARMIGWLHPASMSNAASVVLTTLLANALLSALCALIGHALLPRRLRRRRVPNLLALTALGSILPLLGPPLVLLVGLVYPRLEKQAGPLQPKLVRQPAYVTEMRGHVSHFGAGGALARLRTIAPSGDLGSRALLAIATRRNRESTHLLRGALNHPDETLRLLAHNLLARREERIIAQMNRLEAHRRAHGLGSLHTTLDLAELHLEFVYLGIVSGSLRQMPLDAAQQLFEAIGEPPAEAPWRTRLLLARARLAQQRLPAACEAQITRDYARASDSGAAPARALPWLLECAWRSRDYAQLRQLLAQHPLYRHIPLIGPVAKLWGHAIDA
jgi:hypothetical protein